MAQKGAKSRLLEHIDLSTVDFCDFRDVLCFLRKNTEFDRVCFDDLSNVFWIVWGKSFKIEKSQLFYWGSWKRFVIFAKNTKLKKSQTWSSVQMGGS